MNKLYFPPLLLVLIVASLAGCLGDDVTTSSGVNIAPVADAGADRDVATFFPVTLDGSGSADANGDAITYLWAFIDKPVGSAPDLELFDPTTAHPSFTPDADGDYILRLIVNDGLIDSAPDDVTFTASNNDPIADAGTDLNVVTGVEVELDGSGSYDPEGRLLTYQWTIKYEPLGAGTILSSSTIVNPTFTPNADGDYTFGLVVNDGLFDSAENEVTFHAAATANNAPVADAGADKSVVTGVLVVLDGSGSSDPDGDPINSYQWAYQSQPAGSSPTLDLYDSTTDSPSFEPDVDGVYTLTLVVNDGLIDSPEDTVDITASNSMPIADAGANQSVITGDTVTLDGSASLDPEGGTVSYLWAIKSQPGTASLSDDTAEDPNFVADADGVYTIGLVVNDGLFNSVEDTVDITASNSAPIADAGVDQDVTTGATVTLDGSASDDPDGKTVTYLWTIELQPGTATLSNATAESPTFVADVDGDYAISLVVNDGVYDSIVYEEVVVTAAVSAAFEAGRIKFDDDCGGSCHDAGSYYTAGGQSDLCGDGNMMITNISTYSKSQMSGMTLTAQEILDLQAFLDDPSITPCN